MARQAIPAGAGHITALLALPHNVLLAATDQGLFRSTDGIGWQLSAGAGKWRQLSGNCSGDETVAALSAHGAFASTDARCHLESLRPTRALRRLVRTCFRQRWDHGANGATTALAATSTGLFRSTDGCLSWVKATGLLLAGGNTSEAARSILSCFIPRTRARLLPRRAERSSVPPTRAGTGHPWTTKAVASPGPRRCLFFRKLRIVFSPCSPGAEYYRTALRRGSTAAMRNELAVRSSR